jgi:molybdopterin-binding protein
LKPTSTLAARAATEVHESLGGLSARNQLFGYIEEVRVDGLLAQVQLHVGDQHLTAVITADAARVLTLRRGDDAMAFVKSTEGMIALPPTRPFGRRRKIACRRRRQSKLRAGPTSPGNALRFAWSSLSRIEPS